MALVACGFDTSGTGVSVGLGSGEPADETSSAAEGEAELDGASDTGPEITTGDGDTGEAAGDASEDDGSVTHAAILEISGDPVVQFGIVPIGSSMSVLLDVTNTGPGRATTISATPLAGPFSFVGGAYPGTGGTCEDGLDPGASCTVAVSFGAAAPAFTTGELRLDYDSDAGAGVATRVLRGGGESPNLVVNPGAESGSLAPWGGLGEWSTVCFEVAPHSGSRCFFAGGDVYAETQSVLFQDIVLDPSWAAAIDAGEVVLAFQAQARSRSLVLGDEWRVVVDFRDSRADLERMVDSNWQETYSWTPTSAEVVPPSGTRIVRVRLACLRPGIALYCDAYFDTLSLVASPAE